jgi:hypothetical protein
LAAKLQAPLPPAPQQVTLQPAVEIGQRTAAERRDGTLVDAGEASAPTLPRLSRPAVLVGAIAGAVVVAATVVWLNIGSPEPIPMAQPPAAPIAPNPAAIAPPPLGLGPN